MATLIKDIMNVRVTPTILIITIAILFFFAGVTSIVSSTIISIGSLLIKVGLLYVLVGGSGVIMLHKKYPYFGLALLMSVIIGFVWTANIPAVLYLLGNPGETEPILNLTVNL